MPRHIELGLWERAENNTWVRKNVTTGKAVSVVHPLPRESSARRAWKVSTGRNDYGGGIARSVEKAKKAADAYARGWGYTLRDVVPLSRFDREFEP